MADDPIKGDGEVAPASVAPPIPEAATIDEAFDLIEDWFNENFEDPVHGMPYDGREGGYLYTHGGPYEADDILYRVYGDRLSDSERAEIADRLNEESDAWVPSGARRLPPDDDDGEWDQADWDRSKWTKPDTAAAAAHAEMLSHIEAVEQTLTTIDADHGGMGHNKPPEVMERLPPLPIDREEMGRALAVLKSQPVRPEPGAFVSIEAALKVIGGTAAKVAAWHAARANDFVLEAVKAAGKVAGTGLAGWGAWHQLDADLQALVVAGLKWAGIINPPF